ncbi:putative O-methyltransferase YrrM [Micromonospora palomenae]|uniref:Putative O-methyltransferase YrrM n=1 Tax=Micromonospora palomenae TaxID=1461247 RepID=A0A561WDL7_9ACTN|nr:putative O-methyltransferase YrrM [Micromonospora palomenae]
MIVDGGRRGCAPEGSPLGSYRQPAPRTTPAARRCPIATVANSGTPTAQALQFAESYVGEDLVLRTARSLAREVGLDAVTPGAGAALRLLAAAGNARAVVEIGTGTGVSGVWLLRGMRADGVLTTIDLEVEHQRIARRIFVEAGFPSGRTRIITGRALDVLPRLADGAYDLVFVDAEATGFAAYVDAALRLLRPGGVLALNGTLAGGRIGDPAARDAETVTVRETIKALRESEHWIPALLPVGHGLLAAVKC